MRVIGMAGLSGSGKTTFAGLLAAELVDQGYTVKLDAFAIPLKQRARELSAGGWLDKDKWRSWLQEQGMKMRGYSPFYWICKLVGRNNMDRMMMEAFADDWKPADFLIVTDVRFPDEAEYCRKYGVVILVDGSHRPLEGGAAAHESESHITELRATADLIIGEGMSLADMAVLARDMVMNGRHLKREQTGA